MLNDKDHVEEELISENFFSFVVDNNYGINNEEITTSSLLEQYATELCEFLNTYSSLYNFFQPTKLSSSDNNDNNNYNNNNNESDNNNNELSFIEEKIVDFFIFNHWNKTIKDNEWKEILLNSSLEELMEMSSTGKDLSNNYSKSLQQFIKQSHQFIIPYHPHNNNNIDNNNIYNKQNKKKLQNIISKGMNHKKKYEVILLSNFITNLAKNNYQTIIDIGAGQGYLTQQIASDLFLKENKKNINVYSIDCNECQTIGANKRIEKITNEINDKNIFNNYKAITSHISLKITENEFINRMNDYLQFNNENCNHLNNNLNNHLKNELNNNLKNELNDKMLMIGLHCCGCLSSSMLKLFIKSNANAIVTLGCCYHKLIEPNDYHCIYHDKEKEINKHVNDQNNNENNEEGNMMIGYPMSNFFKKNYLPLSNGGKSFACISNVKWSSKNSKDLKECKEQFLNKSFRCALQYLLFCLLDNNYELVNKLIIRQTCKTNSNTFGSFAYYTLQNVIKDNEDLLIDKLNLNILNKYLINNLIIDHINNEDNNTSNNNEITEEIKNNELTINLLNKYYETKFNPQPNGIIKEIECYWFLRSLLGPPIETLILLDRLFYLKEQENIKEAKLIRLLDPKESPRGVAIVAIKKD